MKESKPWKYTPGVFPAEEADEVFACLVNEVPWVRHGDTPRMEAYYNSDPSALYTYGRGLGRRTYRPESFESTPLMSTLRHTAESMLGVTFEACFLNRYEDARDSLSWHADDSPEMDPERPILVMSFGQERPIQFRPKGAKGHVPPEHQVVLQHGSWLVMRAGMQEGWEHRIPKMGYPGALGRRISLTFRGYLTRRLLSPTLGGGSSCRTS